jgi:hypothetical protein
MPYSPGAGLTVGWAYAARPGRRVGVVPGGQGANPACTADCHIESVGIGWSWMS